MGRYSVKRYKTKRRTRDLDLIYHEDLATKESILKLKDQPLDENKIGMGQFYCIHCAKYFENEEAIQGHYKSKIHKRRVKELKKPYTPLESEAASGLNLQKFMESVEKHKQRAILEKQHQDELKSLVETNYPKGIMLEEQEKAQKQDEVLEEKEVVMEE